MNSFEHLDLMDRFGDIDERILPANQQRDLIDKIKDKSITADEKDILMASLYNLVIKIARRFEAKFPDRSFEDLVSDGLYNLWLRLPTYAADRGNPSTFAQIVVQSAYCKELKRIKKRMVRQTVEVIKNNAVEEQQINVPMMSLSNFQNVDGQDYEPDFLGTEDRDKENFESLLHFSEMILEMYRGVCQTVTDYQILNNIFNIKRLPECGGSRRRKALDRIAQFVNVKMSYVEKVAERVKPWLDKHDFISIITGQNFTIPAIDQVFSKEELDRYFDENNQNSSGNSDEDIWPLLNGNV